MIRQKVDQLERACETIGRDPSSITRSLVLLGLGMSPFESMEGFEDLVGRYSDLGFTDFVLYYPPEEWYPSTGINQHDVFERVVAETIPHFRGSGV